MTKVIGLSGGIASGKSTVGRIFEKLGAVVIDADAIVHELQAPGTPMLAEIAAAFGAELVAPDGALDRARLGEMVFRDAEARRRLGEIVHPKVGAEMMRRLAAARAAGAEIVVLDIPLLFEGRKAGTGSAALLGFDATVLVYAPEALQIERQVEREDYGRDEATRRVRAQMPIEEKRALADFVIDNSGSLAETERQVRDLAARLADRGASAAGRPTARSRLERAGIALASSRAGGWIYDHVCRRVDQVLLPLSRGRLSTGPSQTLLLRTRGARTGRPRSVPLAYVTRGDDLVLIASKGGHPRHPGWYHNLRAHPEAIVEIRGRRERVVAREAEGEEREELWRRALELYPGYEAYQKRAGARRIPVIVLSRA